MEEVRFLKAEDLFELKSVTDPQVSPEGERCVFVQTEMNEEKNEYFSHLHYLELNENKQAHQWTFGDTRNHSPRWSPDGTKIAFVSNREEKEQIYVLDTSGGEARRITSCPNGAKRPIWSPDSKSIAFSVSLKPSESIIADDKEEKEPEPIVVDKMKYKSDNRGFWDGRYEQVAIFELETSKVRIVTSGETDYRLESWSPDGKWLVISGNPVEEQDFSFISDILLLNIETREVHNITNQEGYFNEAIFSPDGKYLGFVGHKREYQNATLSKLWVYHLETKALTCMTDELDMMVGDAVVGDFQQGAHVPGILWGADSESYYFLASENGNTVLYYGTVHGEIYPALLDQQHIYGMSLHPLSQQIVVAISRPTLPGELFLLEVTTGKLVQLTRTNESLLKQVPLSKPEMIQFPSSDGLSVNGWLMKPAGFQEDEKYPLILEIHGGPHAMYANTYLHEFQTLAAKGYVVLYVNPRGSHGYGQEFVNMVRGDYGQGDYEDIMAAVNFAVTTFDFIDDEKLGVTGGSYGGFMTNWIVGHTDRFKAAVTQRSISNWVSFYGVSDIGYYFTEWQIKADMNDVNTLWKHSPLAYSKNVTTPLLILHSEKDYRCPIEQAEQLYITLKRQGKETRMIRFPDSNHELSRSGKPKFRIQRLEHIMAWFEEYLK
ncbi:Dipeptidyl aminopeptidase/acylaminoacyl peptidase [Mesobacillus persicus]|uniref:Dipeptidyl aminopeptidase/acylaminoacyl peptidase n=1 Tax=Mesobacillus persicus TaxID=930146 RepID=A0A1H8E2Q2_9BACI|nr:S9 family peptidase [Mesobacillus persicus]SEN13048.1 Dipeptidyl aminopeptidase/acylaminoacyl peptidase [Mesobacillus persicus]